MGTDDEIVCERGHTVLHEVFALVDECFRRASSDDEVDDTPARRAAARSFDTPPSPVLIPILESISRLAYRELDTAKDIQREHGYSNEHDQVMPYYHAAAGLLQARYFLSQGVAIFHSAISSGHMILAGNAYVCLFP